ncbi:MAG: hypothetical protein ACLSGS_11585 [Adlercreutzia sp.]
MPATSGPCCSSTESGSPAFTCVPLERVASAGTTPPSGVIMPPAASSLRTASSMTRTFPSPQRRAGAPEPTMDFTLCRKMLSL